jgi:hypothetical protein
MAELVVRTRKANPEKAPKEKKFKPFKVTLEFTSREDAVEFGMAMKDYNDDISKHITEKAYA